MAKRKDNRRTIVFLILILLIGLFIGSKFLGEEFNKSPVLSYDALNSDLCTPDNAGAWINPSNVVQCKTINHLLNSQVRCVCELG